MIKTKPNDGIYPIVKTDTMFIAEEGLSKREYFAAAALSAHLSNHASVTQLFYDDSEHNINTSRLICRSAIRFADALIEELNKEPENGK